MLTGRPLTTSKPRPLPRTQIPPDRTTQRCQRRGGTGRGLPGGALGQLTLYRRDVPAPQRQQRTHLVRHDEPVRPRQPGTRDAPGSGTGRSEPAPHRPLRHPQRPRGHPHMACREPTRCPQLQQPAHRRATHLNPRGLRQRAPLPHHHTPHAREDRHRPLASRPPHPPWIRSTVSVAVETLVVYRPMTATPTPHTAAMSAADMPPGHTTSRNTCG